MQSIPHWEEKKQASCNLSLKMIDHYKQFNNDSRLNRWIRMNDCSKIVWQRECRRCGHTMYSAARCKDRLCPICQWRLSLQRHAEMSVTHAALLKEQGYIKAAMLTLTVKNVPGPLLDQTIKKMLSAWTSLTRRREWQRHVKGYARAVELTHKKNGYHPHIHALLYFDKSYRKEIQTTTIVQWWKEALGADYTPVCDIRFVYSKKTKPDDDITHARMQAALAEASKYVMKTDLLEKATPEEIETIDGAIKGLQLVSYGGIIRKTRKTLGITEKTTAEEADSMAAKCKECGSTELMTMAYIWALTSYKIYIAQWDE